MVPAANEAGVRGGRNDSNGCGQVRARGRCIIRGDAEEEAAFVAFDEGAGGEVGRASAYGGVRELREDSAPDVCEDRDREGAFEEDVPKGFGRALSKEDVAKVANPFGSAPLRAAVTQVVGIAAD